MRIRTLFSIALFALLLVPSAKGTQLLTEKLGCENIIPRDKSGFFAYLDPYTGKLASGVHGKRTGLKLTPKDLYPFSTFHEGLTTEKVSQNLTRLDIKGRFRQGSVAMIDNNGKMWVIRIGGEIFLSEAGRCMRAAIIDRYRQGKLGGQQ